ncbi:MAG: hypothetical protein Q9166_007921 [cf. Caloplaca sp. 2 TL-2023]
MASQVQAQALLDGPAMAPPTGMKPNFTSPEDHHKLFVWTIVLTITVSTLALLMRMYTKIKIIRKVGWEDYTSILGFFLWIGYCVPTSLIMVHGGGVHQWNVRLKDLIAILYYSYVSAIMYGITVFIIKLSILLQYMKIFASAQIRNSLYWGILAIIWINFAFYFAITFAEIFLCSPREKYWDVFNTTGHCHDRNAANIAAGCVNSFSDFVIILLPQRVIWKLQMPLKRKLGVSAIFLTGLFVCMTSIIRLYYAIRLGQTGDITWNIALMGFWTYAELSVGVVCGCLPLSPKFFHTVKQKVSTIVSSGSSLRTLLGGSKSRRQTMKPGQESSGVQTKHAPQPTQTKARTEYMNLEKHNVQGNEVESETACVKGRKQSAGNKEQVLCVKNQGSILSKTIRLLWIAVMPMPNIPNYLLYFRDDLRLSTWILWGAAIQSLLVIVLPQRIALLPAVLVLGTRIMLSTLRNEGLLQSSEGKGVVSGRNTAQIPNPDGSFPTTASANQICIFIIATRSNHPKGRFAPGLDEITNYFRDMWQDASRNRETWGYLGKTPTLIATEEDCTNTLVWISYWRSLEDLHSFARGETHRAGWDWYTEQQKRYPHIGIQHETYLAPQGHWENIAYNFRPFGIGKTKHMVQDKDGSRLISPLQPTSGAAWKSMKSRMALADE